MPKSNKKTMDIFEAYELNKPKRFIYIKDLRPINNLKLIFRELRDYFAGNVTGITRDEKIAQNIMRLLFCKIYDERNKNPNDLTEFSNRPDDNLTLFSQRINSLFSDVKNKYADIFEAEEKIEIQPKELSFVVSKIEDYSILNADRDVIGDAFEELIGTSFRGGEGQFFTPRNVVQMMIEMMQPKGGEKILDPACGSGGFLAYTLRYLFNKQENNYFLVGIDKDSFLAKLAKIYLALIGKNNYHIFCENSLETPTNWKKETQETIKIGSFDLILTNPPFGAKIPVIGDELLEQYKLGHKWQKRGEKWEITNSLLDKQSPQILFIERCLQLLKDGGRLGIVLPDGIFGNPSDRYIWEYVSQNASIIGVVSLSQETFQPSTHTKTSVLFLKKTTKRPKTIFMAMANAVGHNKNGKPVHKIKPDGTFLYNKNGQKIIDDDLPIIAKNFWNLKEESHLGFMIDSDSLNNHIFIPEYYNPEIKQELDNLKKSGKYELQSIGQLVSEKILQIRRGNEIGSQFYGTGDVPFVRTSDIVNWEIKVDPVKAVSEEIYEKYKKQQDIQEDDILFVNDGTFLIGRTAMVTRLDLKCVIQSHVRKIRVLNKDVIDPYYLFHLLNSKIVRKQIDSKTFVQATISTIGSRLNEVVLPMILDKKERQRVASKIKDIIQQKCELRQRSMMEILFEDLGTAKNDEELAILQKKFPDYDIAYICQAAGVSRREEREWMKKLWQEYAPYADTHFLKDFKRQFTQRSWELYLGATLLIRGFRLGKHISSGPDFDLQNNGNGRLAWIEAVAVEQGSGNDRVPDMVYGVVSDVPEKEMLFRIANALDKKFKKYKTELAKSIVKKHEPYVIAVNRSGILHVDPDIPLILKILFGIGHLTLRIRVNGVRQENPESFWSGRPKIEKHSGKNVPMLFFEDATHSGISAVIYCIDNILNSPRLPQEMGENFVIVHNPLAKNPLPDGFFSFGDEHRVNGGYINKIRERKNWSKPDLF